MRNPFPPPPEEDAVLQVLVREAPETLAVLRKRDVDVGRRGEESLRELPEDLVEEVLRSTSWRKGAPR